MHFQENEELFGIAVLNLGYSPLLNRHVLRSSLANKSKAPATSLTGVLTGALHRSDNGPEFVAEELRKWLAKVGTETLYIEPGSPWENGYCESFNGKLRDECLNGEVLYSLREAQVVIEKWRVVYNTLRPHSVLGYRSPAPAAFASLPDEVVM